MFMGINDSQRKQIEYEVVSNRCRLLLTRLLRHATRAESSTVKIVLQNNAVNIANHVLGRPIYVLVAEDGDYYYPEEYGWHNAEIELLMQRPDTADLIEIIADLIQEGVLTSNAVNKILELENLSFHFSESGNLDNRRVKVEMSPIEDIEDTTTDEHPNIRLLINRMNTAIENADPPGVLHTSASIFETMAKDIASIDSIQDQPMASFFDRYRKDSGLPAEILDYILSIYKRRNTEPLAGHGSTKPSNITIAEAVILAEMTRAFVRIERQLHAMSIRLEGSEKKDK